MRGRAGGGAVPRLDTLGGSILPLATTDDTSKIGSEKIEAQP
jgi:hypothetical protein